MGMFFSDATVLQRQNHQAVGWSARWVRNLHRADSARPGDELWAEGSTPWTYHYRRHTNWCWWQKSRLEIKYSKKFCFIHSECNLFPNHSRVAEIYANDFIQSFERMVLSFQCIAIFVPVPLLKAFQRVQQRLVRELEKKFSGKHVVVIAQRRVVAKPSRKMKNPPKQKRPRR